MRPLLNSRDVMCRCLSLAGALPLVALRNELLRERPELPDLGVLMRADRGNLGGGRHPQSERAVARSAFDEHQKRATGSTERARARLRLSKLLHAETAPAVARPAAFRAAQMRKGRAALA